MLFRRWLNGEQFVGKGEKKKLERWCDFDKESFLKPFYVANVSLTRIFMEESSMCFFLGMYVGTWESVGGMVNQVLFFEIFSWDVFWLGWLRIFLGRDGFECLTLHFVKNLTFDKKYRIAGTITFFEELAKLD